MLLEGGSVKIIDEPLPGLVAFRSDIDGQVESEGGFDIFVQIGGLVGGDFWVFEIPVAVWDNIDGSDAF